MQTRVCFLKLFKKVPKKHYHQKCHLY